MFWHGISFPLDLCLVHVILEVLKLSSNFMTFELRHLNSMKVSQKAKFGHSIFQVKIKRKQTFQVQQQFQYFEYDMNQTKREESMPSILLQLNFKPLKRTLLNNNS